MLYTHRVVRHTNMAVFGVLDPCIAPPAKFSFHCPNNSSVSFPCAKADAAVEIAPPFALVSVSASGRRKYRFEAFIRTELNVRSCYSERPQELSCPEESVQVTFSPPGTQDHLPYGEVWPPPSGRDGTEREREPNVKWYDYDLVKLSLHVSRRSDLRPQASGAQ
jgi:hypothetical protein